MRPSRILEAVCRAASAARGLPCLGDHTASAQQGVADPIMGTKPQPQNRAFNSATHAAGRVRPAQHMPQCGVPNKAAGPRHPRGASQTKPYTTRHQIMRSRRTMCVRLACLPRQRAWCCHWQPSRQRRRSASSNSPIHGHVRTQTNRACRSRSNSSSAALRGQHSSQSHLGKERHDERLKEKVPWRRARTNLMAEGRPLGSYAVHF